MPLELPPGIVYCAHRAHSLLLPFSLVYLSNRFSGLDFSGWSLVAAYVLCLPIAFITSVLWSDYQVPRKAVAHGAVLPPQVYDKWPGGLSLLLKLIENFKNGYPIETFAEWAEEYGHIYNARVLGENRILVFEPEHIKAILSTQFDMFEKGPVFSRQMHTLFGTGVFNSDGDMWKFHRSMTRPFFSRDRISHFDIFESHAADAISQLKARLQEGHPVDVQDLASRFTMDSATEFLFAQDVESLSAGLPYPHYSPLFEPLGSSRHPANMFAHAFNEAQNITAMRSRWGANWPLAEFWADKAKVHMKLVHKFLDPMIAKAVAKKRASEGQTNNWSGDREVKDGESLLDHLINYTDDKVALRDEILNILLAGRDTTANTITFAIYMLSEHPNILKRLRSEILEKIGSSRRPTFDDMRDLKYLRAFINETLRLYPSVPFNVRTTVKDTVLPNKTGGKPFFIPAQTRVPYSVFLMHRRVDLWGPDALEFDPDRFLDERLGKYLVPNPFIFLPFNAGPRICLGQQFAYHEVSYFLIRLLQSFSSITPTPDAQPADSHPPAAWLNGIGPKGKDKIRPRIHVTLYAMGGCWVSMEEAAET
ncbi:cytochrome P450 monooxygenase pc-3 [Infundibulicybe gibba]|nr:cytochrome P450 monooxygenase pc-3 [Infundibulicybe gibba]